MRPESSAPRFFLDRGLGARIVPDGLRAAGWEIVTMDERYGPEMSQAVADVDWIRDAAGRGECLLTKDTHIAYVPVEAQVVYMCDAKVVTVTNARITGPETLARLLRHEADIYRWASLTRPPFILGVYEDHVRRLKSKFPER